jgi:putative endonuclease
LEGCYNPLIPAQAGIQFRAGASNNVFIRSFPRKRESSEIIMSFFVYILASRRNGTLYIGMTDNLARRCWEHQKDVVSGFTKRYGVKILVWYELHESRENAFQRELQLKKWNRAWKLKLIERSNPKWQDRASELV